VHDRDLADEIELLKDHADLLPYAVGFTTKPSTRLHYASRETDGASVGSGEARQDANERGLARTGCAQKGDHFSGAHREGNIMQSRSLRTESLGHP
jgi:hypothetical protein